MQALGFAALALVTTALAWAVVVLRRPAYAGLALGANAVCMAIIAATLAAQAAALAWALVGSGIMLMTLVALGSVRDADGANAGVTVPFKKLAGVACALVCLAVLLVVPAAYPPGLILVNTLAQDQASDQLGELAMALFTRHAPALVGVVLVCIAALVGAQLAGDES